MAARLREAGIESPEAEARWIAQAAGERDVEELVRRRLSGEPLQYVLGTAAFRRLELRVGPGVFIPRPETEVVAGWAIDRLRAMDVAEPLVVDLCTGSAGIALAIAQELGVPVKLIGIGEALEDLRPFDADDFARALLSTEA